MTTVKLNSSTGNDLIDVKVFKAFLVDDYKGRPGFARISTSAYRITRRSRTERQEITRETWNQAVLPGTKLVQSILIISLATKSRLQCPLCGRKLSNGSTSRARFWCVSSLQPIY